MSSPIVNLHLKPWNSKISFYLRFFFLKHLKYKFTQQNLFSMKFNAKKISKNLQKYLKLIHNLKAWKNLQNFLKQFQTHCLINSINPKNFLIVIYKLLVVKDAPRRLNNTDNISEWHYNNKQDVTDEED